MTEKTDIEIRDRTDLLNALSDANELLGRLYLENLNHPKVFAGDLYSNSTGSLKDLACSLSDNVRFLHVDKIVFNKKENQRNKLVSVYKSIANTNSSVLLLINGNPEKVDFYLGCKTNKNVSDVASILENSLTSNFSGTTCEVVKNNVIADDIFTQMESESYISAVSGIPSVRSEIENADNQFVQGIEKFIDTMRGKKYTMVLIADSKTKAQIEISRRALENLYSEIIPFSESTYTYGANESEAINEAITKGTSHAINKSVSDSITHTVGKNESKTITNTNTIGTNISHSVGSSVGVSIAPYGIGGNVNVNQSTSVGAFSSHSHSIGKTTGTSSATSTGKTITDGTTDTTTESATEGKTLTSGSNKSIQIKFENHSVVKLMEKIDAQLKRYAQCSDLGMWNAAAYFMGETPDIAIMAATSYQSLICGKDSSLENDYVINWNTDQSSLIRPFLMHFEHPEFSGITPGTLVSSAELAIQAGLPNHAVPGLPVLECAEFGRNVATYGLFDDKSSEISLGQIFHMNHPESLCVNLKCDSLTSHVFITGSTGVGKSNTIYKILKESRLLGKKFLVIEPAKGEYKHIFGSLPDVNVYGTNPRLTQLLKLNPFSFNCETTLVQEHIDRLISIFNVCWPMYAAMPAVLKEAIEKSYLDAGWNLNDPFAYNKYENNLFPSFSDVARNIKIIIDSSEYDAENKGAYKGSLLTRLTSLTNGINGMIFSNEEIPSKKLFDENTIIDISRVGSSETQSLLMGILVLKLQEYRMGTGEMNSELKHLTVLEEAHNLLKRSNGETSGENGNMTAKSVEMISNAIAEMRTYGEGFIIADQAPGLLDLASIRNTNTKIIMRLPHLEDRELVGKASGLNDEQITELERLPRGVAAVYQNEWIQSVLCKIASADLKPTKYKYDERPLKSSNIKQKIRIYQLLSKCERLSKESAIKELDSLDLSGVVKAQALELFTNPPVKVKITKIAPIVSAMFVEAKLALKNSYSSSVNPIDWTNSVLKAIQFECTEENITLEKLMIDNIILCITTDYILNELKNESKMAEYRKFIEGGKV